MNAPLLALEAFGKHFDLHEQGKRVPSAQAVSFTVHAGTLTALVGPTGCGKSTVLKGIYRTYRASTGRILYRTASGVLVDLVTADEHLILALRRREIAFVTQFLHCLPRQATLDIVAGPLIAQGVARAEAQERAAALLAAMDLPRRLWSLSPATFSGGERQCVNLARGLIGAPRLLLLDEPTASLDPATAERILDLIEARKRAGTALVAVFHQPELTQRLADQVVALPVPAPAKEGDR